MTKNKLSEYPECLPVKKQKIPKDDDEEGDKIITAIHTREVCKDKHYEVDDWEEGNCKDAILKWIKEVDREKLLTKQEVSRFYSESVTDEQAAIRSCMIFCLRHMKRVKEICDQENNSK